MPPFVITLLLTAALAVAAAHAQSEVQRVSRQHAIDAPPDLKWLTTRCNPTSAQAREQIPERQAAEDLDQLEWLLENRYAYLKLKEVDYRAMLDAIRAGVGREIRRGDLAIQIQRVLARFGDGHTGVDPSDLERALGGAFVPLLALETAEGLVAIKPDRSGFLDDARPILKAIDGVPIERWIEAAGKLAPDGSKQLKLHRTLRFLRFTRYLRSELGLPDNRTARVVLGAAGNDVTTTLDLDLLRDKPTFGIWPRGKTRRLDNNIGYIRLEKMEDDPRALQDMKSALDSYRDARGVILDVRGNGGGKRALIRVLHNHLLGNRAVPRVYNLARLRLETLPMKRPLDGWLADRLLYPQDWRGWTPPHRDAMKQLLSAFKPAWTPPPDGFSEWHALILPMPETPDQSPNERPFVVLMNEECFSATDVLLGTLKGLPNVTLIGAASGGGSGRPERFKLKNSLIDVSLSSMVSYQPDGSLLDLTGVRPDIDVQMRMSDAVGTTDTQLDAAIHRVLAK